MADMNYRNFNGNNDDDDDEEIEFIEFIEDNYDSDDDSAVGHDSLANDFHARNENLHDYSYVRDESPDDDSGIGHGSLYDDSLEDDILFGRNYDSLDDDDAIPARYGTNPRDTSSHKSSSRKSHKRSTGNTMRDEVLSYVRLIVAAVVIAFVFTRFIIVNAQVPSGSMENTIMTGDRLIGFRLAYTFSEPERGDVVIFKYPDDESQNYVKRIIGIPGDVIQIISGVVYVNGEELEEDYIREPMEDMGEDLTYVVPEDSYFMLGDNRNNSKDSRYWTNTFVKKDKIIAKVCFRYYNVRTRNFSFDLIE